MSLIINILVLNTIVNHISDDTLKNYTFGFIFPFLVGLGLSFAPGIYLITTVTDRELRLKYLLNFIGIRSMSY